MTIYRHILRQAWQITWLNRWLWLFGLFAAVLGNGGVFNILINNITSVQNQGALITDLNSLFTQGSIGALGATFVEVLSNLNLASFLVLLLILVLGLFILWLAIVTQGGLISGSFRLHKDQATSFKESWQRGMGKFWPVLWLNVSTRVVTYVLLIILGLPFFFLYVATQNLVWQWFLLVVSFMVFVPVAIIIALLVQYAVMFVVVKNSEFKMAVKESWDLFKQNWIVSIEMALVLFIVNIAAGLGLLIGALFILLPFLILGFLGVYFTINALFVLAFILGGLVLAVAVFTFGAVLATFQTTTWVILFTRLTEGTIMPKILRLAAAWSARRKQLKTE
jgi:hypothetical protein